MESGRNICSGACANNVKCMHASCHLVDCIELI